MYGPRKKPCCRWFPRLTIILFVSFALLRPTPSMAQTAEDAGDIMRRFIKQTTATDEFADFSMRLINADGQVRERTGSLYAKKRTADEDMRLVRFYTPADLAKSGVLTIEHADRDADQWLYLPAYHASRRIASANRSDTYMGTDFAYEDITKPKPEHYQYRMLGTERLRDVECVAIEAVPLHEKLKKESGYAKVVYWIDPEKNVALTVEFYDRAGTLFKRLVNSNLEQFGQYYRWRRAEMHELKRNHRTVLEFANQKIDQGLGDQYFTVRYLERGG